MLHNKVINILSLTLLTMSVLTGCSNAQGSSTQDNPNKSKSEVNVQKRIEKEKTNKDTSLNDAGKNELIGLLSSKYWIYKYDLDDETPLIIYKINKDEIREYDTYSGFYTTYKINKFKDDSSAKMLNMDALAQYHDGNLNVNMIIKKINDNSINLYISKDNDDINLNSIDLKELVQLIYKSNCADFNDSYIQEVLGKTESELYDILGLEFESKNISDSDKNYIESKVSLQEAMNIIFTSKVAQRDNIVVYDYDTYPTTFGNKKSYIITLRSKGEYVDSPICRVFLDVDSGNIYEYSLGDLSIQKDVILDTINIKNLVNKDNQINNSIPNNDTSNLHTQEYARKVAENTLYKYKAYDPNDPEYKMDFVGESKYNNQDYYQYSILYYDALCDFTIGINKSNLEPLLFYSDGSVMNVDTLAEQ